MGRIVHSFYLKVAIVFAMQLGSYWVIGHLIR